MNWNRIVKRLRRAANHQASPRVRYRPRIDSLEERAVPSNLIKFAATDDAASTLTLSGDLEGGGQSYPIMPQGSGALSTTYAGTIKTHVNLKQNRIQFSSHKTALTADNSGDWQPLHDGSMGSAPANYGSMVTVPILGTGYGAIRNFTFAITTSPPGLALSPDANGNLEFPSQQTLATLQGSFDYALAGAGLSGSTDFSGSSQPNQATANGTLTDVNGDGSLYRLVIPIDVTFSFSGSGLTVNYEIAGTITGYGSFNHPSPTLADDGSSPDLGIALAAGSSVHGSGLPAGGTAELDGLAPVGSPSLAAAPSLLTAPSPLQGQPLATVMSRHAQLGGASDLDQLATLDTVFQDLV